jgi:hypothetical protein
MVTRRSNFAPPPTRRLWYERVQSWDHALQVRHRRLAHQLAEEGFAPPTAGLLAAQEIERELAGRGE